MLSYNRTVLLPIDPLPANVILPSEWSFTDIPLIHAGDSIVYAVQIGTNSD